MYENQNIHAKYYYKLISASRTPKSHLWARRPANTDPTSMSEHLLATRVQDPLLGLLVRHL